MLRYSLKNPPPSVDVTGLLAAKPPNVGCTTATLVAAVPNLEKMKSDEIRMTQRLFCANSRTYANPPAIGCTFGAAAAKLKLVDGATLAIGAAASASVG